YRDPADGTRIVAVDVSEDEIRHNTDVDEARVGDIVRDLPFASGEVDMVVSRSVLEHLEDLDAFVAGAARVLRSGGHFVHLFPSRFAPFAIINRALPNWMGRRVMHLLHPRSVGINGFPAFYDRCYDSAVRSVLAARGMEIVDLKLSFYQSRYY